MESSRFINVKSHRHLSEKISSDIKRDEVLEKMVTFLADEVSNFKGNSITSCRNFLATILNFTLRM